MASLVTPTTGEIDENATSIAASATALANIKAGLDTQTIKNDYFYANAAPIVNTDTTTMPVAITADTLATDSEFCADMNETVEFHLAATTTAMNGIDDGDITGFFLLANNVPVAASTHSDALVMMGGRSRSHTLFYKNTLIGDTTFTVAWSNKAITAASAGVSASIDVNNLQWGYKTYEAGYVLEAAASGACP